MRTRDNEGESLTSSLPAAGGAVDPVGAEGERQLSSLPGSASPAHPSRDWEGAISERTCVLTRAKGERGGLIRLALSPDGQVLPDVRAKAPGRGAWLGVDRSALDAAVAKGKLKGALSRAFKTGAVEVPADLGQRIEDALRRDAVDRLGLETRASTLLTGGERIADAARAGKLHLLLHAEDASEDGRRRLDQAWRVGLDEEGSGKQGLVLAADRTMLSMALGRENVVHIGVIDGRAASRVALAVDRWHRFIGHELSGLACVGPMQAPEPRGRANKAMKGFG